MKEKGSTLLIVIGVVLIIIMIGFFKTESSFFGAVSYKKLLNLPCGLSVSEPKETEVLTFPASVRGYVNGCGWEVVSGNAGTVQVFDAYGIAVSPETVLIAPTSEKKKPFAFTATVRLQDVPNTQRGSVIFKSITGLVYAQPVSF